jgi:hypothetical protein
MAEDTSYKANSGGVQSRFHDIEILHARETVAAEARRALEIVAPTIMPLQMHA